MKNKYICLNDALAVAMYSKDVVEGINNLPGIDLVYCKDCKYHDWDNKDADAIVCLRTHDGFWKKGNDFCSYGIRSEDIH